MACLLTVASSAEESPPLLKLTGDWQVLVTVSKSTASGALLERVTALGVSPPVVVTVKAEKMDRLPVFNPQMAGWVKGAPLRGVAAQECTSFGMLDPASLVVRTGPAADAPRLEQDKDYLADLEWATIGRQPNGTLSENQPVYVDYQYATMRIDSIVLTRDGHIELRQGEPHVSTPVPPALGKGDRLLANVFLPGRMASLSRSICSRFWKQPIPSRRSHRRRWPNSCVPRRWPSSALVAPCGSWPGATA